MKLIENNWGKVRCPKCDSVMMPDKEDILESDDDGHYIICPVCKSKIWFGDDNVYDEHPVISAILDGDNERKD